MTKHDRLGGALREVEAPLGKALQEFSPFMSWLDSDLQLTYGRCGIVTAALQLYLAEACSVQTNRRIASLTFTTAENSPADEIQHVILQTDNEQTICPTYTQFYDLIGLSSHLAQDFEDMKALLPEQKIALFPTADAEEFGEKVGEDAFKIRGAVKKALSTRALSFFRGDANIYEEAPRKTVIAGYRNIWHPEAYQPFPFAAQVAEQNGEQFEACVRNIVDAI